jgi:hypothetical protein
MKFVTEIRLPKDVTTSSRRIFRARGRGEAKLAARTEKH